ncbi:hypothetical protein BC941DRAFT_190156 [Chlamydoabsidia padenii]|nr:hypothetical protein BC941DRAFT_190156 [Chlamydoabsidia padenii]
MKIRCSGLVLNWDDTISVGPERTNRRMDLRILCVHVEAFNDVGNGEFARSVQKAKYFHDKRKLVLNGKAQYHRRRQKQDLDYVAAGAR